MNKKPTQDFNWLNEFKNFSESKAQKIPVSLDLKILGQVAKDLAVRPFQLLAKYLFFHFISVTLTLTFCPQFGIGLLEGHGISHFFMQFGKEICMVMCGSVCIGSSALLSAIFLRRHELRWMRSKFYTPILATSLVTLGVFAAIGGEIVFHQSLFWLAGGLITAFLSSEIVSKLKVFKLQHA